MNTSTTTSPPVRLFPAAIRARVVHADEDADDDDDGDAPRQRAVTAEQRAALAKSAALVAEVERELAMTRAMRRTMRLDRLSYKIFCLDIEFWVWELARVREAHARLQAEIGEVADVEEPN